MYRIIHIAACSAILPLKTLLCKASECIMNEYLPEIKQKH